MSLPRVLSPRRGASLLAGLRPSLSSRRGRSSCSLAVDLPSCSQAAASLALQRKLLPSTQIRCRITASLRASATRAFLPPRRPPPRPWRRPAPDPGQEAVGHLVEHVPGERVALLGDPPRPLRFARLMAPRRQTSEPSAACPIRASRSRSAVPSEARTAARRSGRVTSRPRTSSLPLPSTTQ